MIVQKDTIELRRVLKAEGLTIKANHFLTDPEHDMEDFPTWPGMVEDQNAKQVEYHRHHA